MSLLIAAASVLAGASVAHAGVYTVSSCDGSGRFDGWFPIQSEGYGAAYADGCPGPNGLVARSVSSADTSLAPFGSTGLWAFGAPSGTRIVEMSGDLKYWANFGAPWRAGIKNLDTNAWQLCPGPGCNSQLEWVPFDLKYLSQHGIAIQTVCTAGGGCRRDGTNRASAQVRNLTVYIADDQPPSVGLGGSLTTEGWKAGTQVLEYSAQDNTGIRTTRTLVGGIAVGRDDRPCDPHRPVPCGDAGGALPIDTRAVFKTDGHHTITIEATDGGYNLSSASRSVLIDNTPPPQPDGLTVEQLGTWQTANRFVASWSMPVQAAAPVAAARYRLCPIGGPTGSCVQGQRTGAASRIEDLELPTDGQWELRIWQRDAAGNEDANRSAVVSPLRLDRTPPELSLDAPRPEDPARLRVAAADATSGVARIDVEVRKHGSDAWTSVPVMGDGVSASAVIDDERFRAGVYDVRARATDAAGNERTTTVFSDQQAAVVALPLRVVTRLRAGAKARHGKRTRLTRVVSARFGRRPRIHGRLTAPGGNGLAGADVEVWQRVNLPGTRWKRIGVVHTSPRGRLGFRAPRGPNRLLLFRYPGTPTLRGASRYVRIDVPASTTMRSTPRRAVNGEYVRFHGQLHGGRRPRGGKLVELQVYSRRRWRTFAQPRANRRTGRWSFQYRFETVVGHVTFRFRARIRKEAAYPFEPGKSRPIRVQVTGV